MEAGQYARQSLSGGRDMEEEMQHVLQFLDTSLITPPSGSDLATQQQRLAPQQQRPQPQQQQQPTPEQLREMATLQDSEGAAGYNELGEVIDLLGSLDANDSDSSLLQQQQQQSGPVYGNNGNSADVSRPTAPTDGTYQRVQLPRSTSVSSNHSGVDSISPVGLLSGPSMSPATINWLQSLVPSTSTESLTGLISPATLYGAGGGSASGIGGIVGSNAQADGVAATKSDRLPRSPSCEIIDWKAYNDSCADKTQKEPSKWRVIPQHGPHADPVSSSSASNPMSSKLPPGGGSATLTSGATASELSAVQLAARKLAEERNKRKALVSPEYVQYGNLVSGGAPSVLRDPSSSVKIEPGSVQYATKVPEPTGRRPFKKSLHQSTVPGVKAQQQQQQQQSIAATMPTVSSTDGKDDLVRCKCTGKCRNARCACVKAGLVCGAQCKCVSCANPFVPMASEGIDIQLMVRDICLMQYLSKIKDMQELLDSTVSYECCEGGGGVVQVKHTVENGFACPHCSAHFTYSWCNNRLCPDAKKPRRHCAKCRRCGDHRNQHCDLCNHCYFAGVANSFRCSCQSSGSGGGTKTRAVVPNPVRRDTDYTTKPGDGDKQNGPQQFGAVNPAVESAARDGNADANNSSKPGAEEEADDSCKMQ